MIWNEEKKIPPLPPPKRIIREDVYYRGWYIIWAILSVFILGFAVGAIVVGSIGI